MPRRFPSRRHAAPTRVLLRLPLRLLLALGLALLTLPVLTAPASAFDVCTQGGSVDTFMQNTDKDKNGDWVNGDINDNKGNLVEGGFVWQRLVLQNLSPGPQQVVLTYDVKDGGKYAYDFLDHFSLSTGGAPDVAITNGGGPEATATLTWDQPDGKTSQTLVFGAHIASELDWGPGMGAGSIPGSSYHVSLETLNCTKTGQRDNQIKAGAVKAGWLTVVKDAVPDAPDDFDFSLVPSGKASQFTLDDDPSSDTPSSVTYWVPPDTYSVTEAAADGWNLAGAECSPADGTRDGRSVSVAVADEAHVTCTFTNKRAASVTVEKFWSVDGADPVVNGEQPDTMSATLRLTGPGDAAASAQPWGEARSGYTAGDNVTIGESADLPANCWLSGRTIAAGNGAPEDLAAGGNDTTLGAGSNSYRITNDVTCREVAQSATVTVEKLWVVDGGDPVANGKQPQSMTAALTVTGPGDAAASEQPWGSPRAGYFEGDVATINEASSLPSGCSLTGRTIAAGEGEAQPLTDQGYDAELGAGGNAYTVTNSVTCTTPPPPPPPPPATSGISVLKLDAETQAPLRGAQFQAYRDTNGNGAPDAGDQALGAPATTGTDGTATWNGLGYGTYLVVETQAPAGYDLPANAYQAVTFGSANAGTTAHLVFVDGPQGSIGIVKAAFEKEGGSWVASDGEVPFGSTVRYVMTVTSTGAKVHHDVTVGDYVPGYDPTDSTSTGQAAYVDGSASCDPGPCVASYDPTTHEVTWDLGDLEATTQSAAFEVRIPQPTNPTYVDGVFTQLFANTASMGWTDTTRGPRVLPSNEVTVRASVEVLPAEAIVPPAVRPQHARPPLVKGVEAVLPATGAEAGSGWLLSAGGLAVVLGVWLARTGRRRTR